jgi:hypothetical protein
MPLDIKRNQQMLDGSSWLLEGFNPGGNLCTPAPYQLVDRNSPDSSVFLTCTNYFNLTRSTLSNNKNTAFLQAAILLKGAPYFQNTVSVENNSV